MNLSKIEQAMGRVVLRDNKRVNKESPQQSKARAEARAVSKARQSRKSMRASSERGSAATQILSDTGPLTGSQSEPFSDSIPELTREEVRELVKREARRRKLLKQAVQAQGAAVNDAGTPQQNERRVRNEPRVAKLERRVSRSSLSLANAATEPFDTVVHSLDMPATIGEAEPRLDPSSVAPSDSRRDSLLQTTRLRADSVGTKAVKMRKDRSRTGARVELKLDELFAQGYLNNDGKPSPHGQGGAEGKPLPLMEEFRRIKRPLLANAFGQGLPAAHNGERIMITSALPSEGKSFCAIHLALSIASEVDTSVLLVEADVAKPTVLKKLDLPRAKGLANWFADPRIDVRDLTLSTNIPGLKILPAGMEAPDSIDMLASRAMTTFFDRLREAYPHDLIIVDAPPLLPATETKVLATNMGQVVVVVEAGETPKTVLADALEMLKDIEIVGLVLNKSLRQPKSAGYGYGYGY